LNEADQIKQTTARLSIFSNTVLIVLKLIVGVYSGAVSIVSEAAHSGVDLLAAVIAFLAVRNACRPPDTHHAYGHGKLENLSGAAEAALIIGAALWIVFEAVEKLFHPVAVEFLGYGLAVMGVSAVVNWLVSERLYRVARQTESQALEADALHLRADVWTSAGVFAGLAIIKLTGIQWLDPAIAIIVAAIIFNAGFRMTKKSLYELTDVALPPEEEAVIREIIASYGEVINYHRLRTRRSGSRRLVDVHLVFAKDSHLDAAHAVCDRIEDEIQSRLGQCDVVIHLEPDLPTVYDRMRLQ